MSFVSEVLKSLMTKGLTRKEAKEVFNANRPSGQNPALAGRNVSRQVARKVKREGGFRHS